MEWLDRLAQTFELDAPTNQEIVAVLDTAREVAHRVERRITPVSTFLLGMNVERRVSAGASRQEALTSALAALEGTLPAGPAEEGPGHAR